MADREYVRGREWVPTGREGGGGGGAQLYAAPRCVAPAVARGRAVARGWRLPRWLFRDSRLPACLRTCACMQTTDDTSVRPRGPGL